MVADRHGSWQPSNEPVARTRRIEVRTTAVLGEGRRLAARDVVASLLGTDALVRTHDEVLNAILRGLAIPGVEVDGLARWTRAEARALTQEPTISCLVRPRAIPASSPGEASQGFSHYSKA